MGEKYCEEKEPYYSSIIKNDDGEWVVFGSHNNNIIFNTYKEAEAFLERNLKNGSI